MAFKEISKIEVMSIAKLTAAVYGAILLIIGVLGFIFSVLMAAVSAGYGTSMVFGLFMGIFLLVLYPVIGVIFGFIGGAVFALIYNLAAAHFGGIKIELK